MCMHFLLFFVGLYRAVGMIYNDRKSFSYAAGGLEALKSPSRSRTELKKSGILRCRIQPKNSTLWFSSTK